MSAMGRTGPDASRVRRFRVTPSQVPDRTAYVPVPFRSRLQLVSAECGDIELKHPDDEATELIGKWLSRPSVFRPLGFTEGLGTEQVSQGWLPDLTIPEKLRGRDRLSGEPVEFLVVTCSRVTPALGFCVVYEGAERGDPNQEIDLAVVARDDGARPNLFRVRSSLLGYLFVLCGARSVEWQRLKRARVSTPGGRSATRIDRAAFRRRLEAGVGPEVVLTVGHDFDRQATVVASGS